MITKATNYFNKFTNFIKPKAAGANINSASGYLQCLSLDKKYENIFKELFGDGNQIRFSENKVLILLNKIRGLDRNAYDKFYPSPKKFLEQARVNGKDHFWNDINNY